MSSESEGEKIHDPTPEKRQDARKQGDIARSADMATAAVYLAMAALVSWPAGQLLGHSAAAMRGFLDHSGWLASRFDDRLAAADLAGPIRAVTLPLLPFLLAPFLAALAAFMAQRAIVFVPSRLAPKLNRISLFHGFSNRFGRSGLFEFTKSLTKLAVIALVAGTVLSRHAEAIIGMAAAGPRTVFLTMCGISVELTIWIGLVAAMIAFIDYGWQRFEHTRRLRMSMQELRDELRESEGDPHVKGQRRRRAIEIATSRMLLDVPMADVVIVNPTHFAVALKWSRLQASAPVCVAKGTDEMAARIRAAAIGAGVPVRSDPPTARSIHDLVAVGQEIRPEHFKAVAAAIQFSERMRRAARERNGG